MHCAVCIVHYFETGKNEKNKLNLHKLNHKLNLWNLQ